MAIVNERHQVKSYPTPLPVDLLFYEIRDSNIPRNETFTYGDPHPNTARYPDHELVFVTTSPTKKNESCEQQWWYAARRENQDLYNFELVGGEQVIRTYVIPRSLYFARPVGHGSAVAGEFLYPPAGTATPDDRYGDYCFADDTQRRLDPEFDSLYVVIQRRFIRPTTVEYAYDEQFKRSIRITKEVIPKTTAAPTLGAEGTSVEIQDGNNYHSVRITKELILTSPGTYPYSIPTLPGVKDFNFPSKLASASLVYAWAYARADGHRDSFSEDYYFKFRIINPRPGPYSATVTRWVTNEAGIATIKAANPITLVPTPVRESISVVGWWWYASEEHGTATSATAKEWAIPATIHGEVTIDPVENPTPDVTIPPAAGRSALPPIAATSASVAAFFALTEATIDYKVRELPLGLYEVSVVKINIANLYG